MGKLENIIRQRPQLLVAIITFTIMVLGSLLYYIGLQVVILFTPLLLGCMLATLIFFWPEDAKKKIITIGVVAVSSFIVGAVGVNTGIVFGDFSYGNLLGWKIFGTPLFLGLLWFLVSYSTFVIVSELSSSNWAQLSLGVVLIVSFDLILEQFAVLYKLWIWPGNEVPLLNYITWAVLGLLYIVFYKVYLKKRSGNFQLYASLVLPMLSVWIYLMLLIKSI